MTALPYIVKLSSRDSCPACGSARAEFITVPYGSDRLEQAVSEFECDATFRASEGGIVVVYPCPSRSVLAADLMTLEVEGKVREERNLS